MQNILRNIDCVIVNIVLLSSISFSQIIVENTQKSNYEIFQMLSSNLADSLIYQNGLKQGDSITFDMISTPNDWFVEHQIIKTLQDNNIIDVPLPASGIGSQMQIECAVSKLFVNYSNVHRDGFFGNRKVSRAIGIELSGKIFVQNTTKVIRPIYTTYKDTVLFRSINSLEEQNIPATKGIIPDDSLIERFIIPSVVVSTVAVITYLFFTLRN